MKGETELWGYYKVNISKIPIDPETLTSGEIIQKIADGLDVDFEDVKYVFSAYMPKDEVAKR